MRNMRFCPQFIWLKLKVTVDRKHRIGRKFSHVTIQTEELGYFKPECIFLIIIYQPVHILTRNIKTVSMSSNILSLAKKVLIYYKISDFQSKRLQNNYRDECLLVTFVIQRCSYKKIFWKYAQIVQEDTHAPANCIFTEIKPQVFYKLDACFLMHIFVA